jgi:hypothetical protein
MSAACKVCHRTLRNPASILIGIGPVCARKSPNGAATGQTNLPLDMTTEPQSHFTIQAVTADAVLIIDLDDGAVSVTNDAAAVVAHLLARFGNPARCDVRGPRIIYRDSMMLWSELRHAGGSFVGYAPLTDGDRTRYDLK